MVLTLLILDWVLFDTPALASRLPIGNNDGSPNDKLLLAARYPDAQVLYLGDSRIFYGVDPIIVSESCRCGPGFNGAIPAADPGLTRIMADHLLRRLSPRLVVLGLSQWELSDEARIPIEDPAREIVPPWQLAELGMWRDDPAGAQEWLSAAWRLYRYRGEVRAALDEWASTSPREDPRRGFEVYSERRRLREEDQDRRERQWFSDFSVEGRRAGALRGMLADLRARGIEVVLVAPPLYPDFHAQVRREVATFHAVVEELANEHGAAFVDVTEPQRIGLTPSHFLDVVHLNEEGTTIFSRHLGAVLGTRLGAA